MTTGDGLPGMLAAVAAGSLLAAMVAVGLSPVAPLGSVRAVYPYPGMAFDWAVLGLGAGALAGVLPWWPSPSPTGARLIGRPAGPAHASAGLGGGARRRLAGPAAARGRGRQARRRSRLGTQRGAGPVGHPGRRAGHDRHGGHHHLRRQPRHPRLSPRAVRVELDLRAELGKSHVRLPAARGGLLDHDPAVAAWTGVYFATFKMDGLTVPSSAPARTRPSARPC